MSILPLIAFTPTTDTSLQIMGYYDRTDSTVKLTVSDYNGSQMYYASNVQVSSGHLESATAVFSWEMVGNMDKSATVSFRFSEMQAYLNNKYYRPAYTIGYVKNATTVGGVEVADGFAFSSNASSGLSNSKITKTKQTQTYMFDSTATFVFSGSRSNNNGATWTRSGYFTLYISDYDNTTSGEFKYRSNVTVEYEIQ